MVFSNDKMQCGVCKQVFFRPANYFKHLKYGNKHCRELCLRVTCKQCGKGFVQGAGSKNNPDFCSDDCNYEYHEKHSKANGETL